MGIGRELGTRIIQRVGAQARPTVGLYVLDDGAVEKVGR
jgi:hypothetical protein